MARSDHKLTKLIAALAAGSAGSDDLERAKAFFEFCSHICWPTSKKSAELFSRILMARYVGDLFVKDSAADQVSFLPSLLQYAPTSDIITLCLGDEMFLLTNEWVATEKQHLVSRIVRFIISYQAPTAERRDRPSIQKAYYLLKNNALWGAKLTSWRSFSESWSTFKNVSPFLFVREFAPKKLSMGFAPTDRNFLPAVQNALDHPTAIHDFLAQSKWVTEQLRETLDIRALREANLPTFPTDLAAKPVPLARTAEKMDALLTLYGNQKP